MKDLLIILDNGHGTRAFTRGKCSPDRRIYEGEWSRDFVKRLKCAFCNNGFYTHILVPEEADVSLGNRVLRTNNIIKNLDKDKWDVVLLSIHINAAASDDRWHDAKGFSSWIYDKCSKKSEKLGYIFGSDAEMRQLTGNRWIPSEKAHRANFKILRETNCPAVLLENMFQDNKEDVDFLLSEEGKQKLIDMYVNVMKTYYSYINK